MRKREKEGRRYALSVRGCRPSHVLRAMNGLSVLGLRAGLSGCKKGENEKESQRRAS